MRDVVIRAEHLGKRYIIGHNAPRERYTSLRDVVARTTTRFLRTAFDVARGHQLISGDEIEEFWALKDVSFELKRGDVVGVIGRNGAGKSTLLKVLSRITEPTSGRVEIKGRIASLLEVGTGFHPELTGRENIFLNGAILGMRRAEIERKFDEIVAFAEVEKFLDTPVKRYSSGMYVRLAFAVAAHLEPEILVVDEVLAVGDAEFQRKCLGKMKDVAGQGRTVIFVSHNLAAVKALCTRSILLRAGRVACDGSVDAVIKQYVSASDAAHSISFDENKTRPAISAIEVNSEALIERDLIVDIHFASPRPLHTAVGGIVLRADTGEPVWGSNSRFHPSLKLVKGLTHGVLRCEARQLPIRPGRYSLSAWLGDWHEDHDARIDVLSFVIGEDDAHVLRPPVSAVGHLDWPAEWGTADAASALPAA
ncbi:ABC transporter ATP-binding protein [Hyphomicrobium facile]|uniref:Lipopolysaccharide transport system ATP-binding protein n=1 Tax=Hyphomicrobium facile TaxID=51670 RepID=A0A1I7NKB7_9HYPH|nr:ABC transporter ATP-binding protein [Hyphomicrobium facile]SFV35115.1 lipopolysaccharide transport system ATP-binding protein [Hyphomicrobium facile]